MLVNGVPITQVYLENRGFRSTLPIENISRVEVIRGPGSAIYGANAFAGVINVITKNANEINGTQDGGACRILRYPACLVAPRKPLGRDECCIYNGVAALRRRQRTHYSIRRPDRFSTRSTATSASLAPGPPTPDKNAWTCTLNYQKGTGDFTYGIGGNTTSASAPASAWRWTLPEAASTNNYYTDLVYHNPTLDKNWDFTTRLVYEDFKQSTYVHLFPPGASYLPIGQNGKRRQPSTRAPHQFHGWFNRNARRTRAQCTIPSKLILQRI